MKKNRIDVMEQMLFCKKLMNTLVQDCDENIRKETTSYYIPNRSRMKNDIIRLRRELNTFAKMLEEW